MTVARRAAAVLGAVVVVVLALGVVALAGAVQVRGASMAPALDDGDRVLVRDVDVSALAVGDLVVVRPAEGPSPSVKRVVARAGDAVRVLATATGGRVEVRPAGGGAWLVRAVAGPEVSLRPCCGADGRSVAAPAEVVVPPGAVWVLGDALDVSVDSREIGFVSGEDVLGRPWLRLWPTPGRIR